MKVAVQRYAYLALLAAALFGASTPFAKSLVGGGLSPTLMAGLLYLGSGLGLTGIWLARNDRANLPRGRDWWWLLGAVVAGGIGAPLLLMHGLVGTLAGNASLLLNLESVLTTALAYVVFREPVGARVWTAAGVMLLAATILSYDPNALSFSVSSALILGACLLWAVDNNLTRNVSASDAVFLAMVKGLVAGVFNVSLAFVLGASITNVGAVGLTLVVGFLGYGISLVLFILALRHLGTARTGAHFATAPFFGSALAILFLGEPLSVQFLLGFALMSGATYLVLTERHAHEHTHEPMVHTHEHVHDTHHRHSHAGDEGPEPHTHPHVHEALTHSHEHLPDLHHRHGH